VGQSDFHSKKRAARREQLNSRLLNVTELPKKLLLPAGENSNLLLGLFRVWKIIRLVGTVVLSSHLRILCNLREIVIEKRESRIIDIVQVIGLDFYGMTLYVIFDRFQTLPEGLLH